MKVPFACLAFLLIIAFVIFVLLPLSVYATSANLGLFPPGSKPYGLPYEEHIKNFWKWQISIPTEPEGEHPIDDTTGEKCQVGQAGSNSSVFYLSGSGGAGPVQRTCIVPAGKGVLIPVMTVIATEKEYPGLSMQELVDTAKSDQDNVASLSLVINGTSYSFDNLKKYRTDTAEFQVVFPKAGLFGITEEGPSKAVADGYYLLTEPLERGTYQLHFKGTIPSIPFSEDIKYTLIVK
jgi:hypothetical protein